MAIAYYCDKCGEIVTDPKRDLRKVEFKYWATDKPDAPTLEVCAVCNEKIKEKIQALETSPLASLPGTNGLSQ